MSLVWSFLEQNQGNFEVAKSKKIRYEDYSTSCHLRPGIDTFVALYIIRILLVISTIFRNVMFNTPSQPTKSARGWVFIRLEFQINQ